MGARILDDAGHLIEAKKYSALNTAQGHYFRSKLLPSVKPHRRLEKPTIKKTNGIGNPKHSQKNAFGTKMCQHSLPLERSVGQRCWASPQVAEQACVDERFIKAMTNTPLDRRQRTLPMHAKATSVAICGSCSDNPAGSNSWNALGSNSH